MARTRKYKTLKGLMKALNMKQFSALDMRRECWFFSDTRQSHPVILSEDAQNEFWKGIAQVVWERNWKANINNLRFCKTFGLMSRLIYDGKRCFYCAGQDYPSEIRVIQRTSRK